ncbi:MAG: DHA2 family efflux MFS transporter permease subunit [SAR324 cluster bacterium]|nr:DHA2 family efflux MFS transporter permease subunit [SAR324 cluster bacterium]
MTEASPTTSPNPNAVLVVVMVGTFLSVLDTTILNVALPYIVTSFGSNVEEVKWVTTGFMIAAASTMPLTSWLGQRFGYGNLYIAALSVFTAGAAMSAMSWTLDSLIFARIVQGMGAGLVQPASIAILSRSFPPRVRGRAFGIWTIGMMTAPTLGPTTGGLMIEFFNWRSIFSLSLLVGGLAVLLAVTILSREREKPPLGFDWKGYSSFTVAMVAAFLVVTYGQQEGWTSGIILLGCAVSLVAFVLFLIVEWDAEQPIVPLRLFRIPDFSLTLFLTLYRSLGLFGGVFLLPIFLYQVQGRDSVEIGLMMIPGSIVMAIMSPISGVLTDRFGGKWPAIVGIVFMAYFLYLYQSVDFLSARWLILYPQIFQGMGIALVMTPLITTGMNAVNWEDGGHASWMINLCQRGGGAFSISILGTMLHRETIIQKDYLGGSTILRQAPPEALVQQGMSLGLSSQEARPAAMAAVGRMLGQAALSQAFKNIFILCAIVTITAIVPALLLSSRRPNPEGEAD